VSPPKEPRHKSKDHRANPIPCLRGTPVATGTHQ
jgi:hypothetical protein